MAESLRKENGEIVEVSDADRYFLEQRDFILQDINQTLDSILNGLNGLNISLENFIAVGKEFENVSELWKRFYSGTTGVNDGTEIGTNPDDIDPSSSGE
ncbi:LAFE_0E03686g1_1 [Lachancea fermentati]|uniref:DASH complex subunit DAD1 n=1 Tax=Lachancea fermentati TaxID=4955 RepID=A0A1G4MCJ2_LACFM|nr:LAFE_0E03686g1_1 [Lachancea fermentati]